MAKLPVQYTEMAMHMTVFVRTGYPGGPGGAGGAGGGSRDITIGLTDDRDTDMPMNYDHTQIRSRAYLGVVIVHKSDHSP